MESSTVESAEPEPVAEELQARTPGYEYRQMKAEETTPNKTQGATGPQKSVVVGNVHQAVGVVRSKTTTKKQQQGSKVSKAGGARKAGKGPTPGAPSPAFPSDASKKVPEKS